MKDKKEKKQVDKKGKKKNIKLKNNKLIRQLYQIGLRGYSLYSAGKATKLEK